MIDRRSFIKTAAMASVAGSVSFSKSLASMAAVPQIACEQYTWYSYFLREKKKWMDDPAASLRAMKEAGCSGYEPSIANVADVSSVFGALKTQKIWSKSMYVNSVLHEPELVEKNISEIMEIATAAKKHGISILVTNPTPIRWGGNENKTDEQLKGQGIALNLLGKQLAAIGITLAYHNHDAEMRESAREFHHMLHSTDPAYVKFCLDAHWVYRGSGNSQIALFDIVDMYADRIVEVHIRQSQNGIWSEVFGDGDIDYARLAKILSKQKAYPHLVLEQAVEEGTPHTLSAIEAIGKSLEHARNVFS